MGTLSLETRLQVPANTYINYSERELILASPTGSKTITGEHASECATVLKRCDGNTPLGDFVDGPDDYKFAIAETLYQEGIVYPIDFLAPLELDDQYLSLFESLLLSLDQSEQRSFTADIQAKTIAIRGDTFLVDNLTPKIQSIGWNVDTGSELVDADVVLFLETELTDEGVRTAINKQWLDSEAALIRAALYGDEIRVGPLLTPTARACLECLTTREQMNNATSDYDYESLTRGWTLGMRILNNIVIQVTAQAATELIPPSLEGMIKTLRVPTVEYTESQLLGVPGCESCGR